MLRLEEITKDYKTGNSSVSVLKGISLQFRKNEFVAILGHSGCGKTTLLNIIGGLDKCTSGNVVIDGRTTKDYNDLDWNDYRNKRIGFVFQSYNLIPHLTVVKNVELSMTLAGISKEERHARALEALDKVGLIDHAKKRPSQLSGGQMQRVAIARAIVNNPEIVLADEPTGALDSESGIEVMELLKEISNDRLIIMVTHNSQLADEYATRIVNMSDGVVTSDSDEYSLDDFLKDEQCELDVKAAKENEEVAKVVAQSKNKNEKSAKRTMKRIEKKKRRKASMSPLTAFSLSFTNLISKKGRTFLTSFAGSIGIIGIMLVLALSTGARSFIAKMEENALSQYPVEISESNTDLSAILSLLTTSAENRENYPEGDTIYTAQVIGNLLENKDLLTSKNDLKQLKSYIEENFDESLGYVKYDYGTDFDVFCNYTHSSGAGEDEKYMKVQPFIDAIADIPALSSFSSQLEMFSSYLTLWDEMTDNTALLNQQYELLGNSKWPTNYDEVVLVLDRKNQLNDYALFALGLKSKDDILNATMGDKEFSNSTFSISDIIGENGGKQLQYQIATGCDYYYQTADGKWEKVDTRSEQRDNAFVEGSFIEGRKNTVNVKVVGVVRPREDAAVTSINGNIGYTPALTRYLSERASEHPLVQDIVENVHGINGKEFDSNEEYDQLLLDLGVSDVDKPKKIKIYASSFDSKEQILSFLDNYNTMLQDNGETPVKYSDNLSIIMDYVESMTATITGVLIGFAAISLVVSSIMIAIIIYTSVLERKKEIGVLRSIGARKLDVSGVFIAESGIIGCLSGVLGIVLSYILMLPLNAIIFKLFMVKNLATLTWWQPLMMFGISVALAVIAGFVPSRIAANKDPVECLRSE